MKYIDLHTHTFYSDGLYTPAILARSLALVGMDVISKTDHDTNKGYKEAKKEADRWGIIAIPGVELSTTNYHILGYNFDPDGLEFNALMDRSMEMQRQNCQSRVEMLAEHGVPITMEKVQKRFPESRLGKMNIFITLLTDEECRNYIRERYKDASPDEIKSIYLGKQSVLGKGYKSIDLSSEEAIEGVHKAGGLAILAHPGRDVKKMEEELGILREQGIDGLEIQPNFYKNYPIYEEYAKEHGLLLTYGSDYHGAYINRGLLGRGINVMSPELEERLVDNVPSALLGD